MSYTINPSMPKVRMQAVRLSRIGWSSRKIVKAILDHRHIYGRCAEVIHYQLVKDGHIVSLSSVKRTLKRNGLTYPSKWKKWHKYPPRPIAEKPGMLVQIDTTWDENKLKGM